MSPKQKVWDILLDLVSYSSTKSGHLFYDPRQLPITNLSLSCTGTLYMIYELAATKRLSATTIISILFSRTAAPGRRIRLRFRMPPTMDDASFRLALRFATYVILFLRTKLQDI